MGFAAGQARFATHRSSRARGFTLLELVLAIAIFALISVAVLAVFRTGTRTYQSSHREMMLLQRARYTFDIFERDIMNAFYRDEKTYNVEARKVIQDYQQSFLDAVRSGNYEDFNRRYGPRDEERENDPNYIGNPFEKVKLVDLQFVGKDSEDRDSISFTIQAPLREGSDYHFWGLARVQYTMEDNYLIRSIETIDPAPRTWDNNPMEKTNPPEREIVAEGVRVFDLSYAFWWDNQWYETSNWSSSDRQIRNNQFLLGEYKEKEETAASTTNVPQPGDAGWNDYLNEQEDLPADGLPTYVRLRVVLEDPTNPGHKQEMERIFRAPNSLETWTPNQNLVEEDREMESAERDKKYVPVYPGALKKRAG